MAEKNKIDSRSIVEKLAAEERKMVGAKFLAPLVGNGRVRVRVSGIPYEMQVANPFVGWALLRMNKPGTAEFIEAAPPELVSKYLKLFVQVRVVLLKRFGDVWWCLQSSTADTRVQLQGPVPIHLVGAGASFDTVYARFDGNVFWFESIDRRRDPRIARTLQKSLQDKVAPEKLVCSGAVPQEKLAYKMLWLDENSESSLPLSDAERISRALSHAGARLEGFQYQPDRQSATVRFQLDGSARSVVVRMDDLSVESAGICLSGMDADFDLSSLVGVLRESETDYY